MARLRFGFRRSLPGGFKVKVNRHGLSTWWSKGLGGGLYAATPISGGWGRTRGGTSGGRARSSAPAFPGVVLIGDREFSCSHRHRSNDASATCAAKLAEAVNRGDTATALQAKGLIVTERDLYLASRTPELIEVTPEERQAAIDIATARERRAAGEEPAEVLVARRKADRATARARRKAYRVTRRTRASATCAAEDGSTCSTPWV